MKPGGIRLSIGVGLVLGAVLVCGSSGPAAPFIRVVYLGRQGFLVRTQRHALLVNAPDAVSTSTARAFRDRWLDGGAPVPRMDLVVVTEARTDTFDPEAVAAFLEAHPGTWFVSTPPAIRGLRFVFATRSGVSARLRGFLPAPGRAFRLQLGGLSFTVLRARPDAAALAVAVRLERARVLLAGSVDVSDARVRAGLQRLGCLDGAVLGHGPDPVAVLRYLRQRLQVAWVAMAGRDDGPQVRIPGVVVLTRPFQTATFPLPQRRCADRSQGARKDPDAWPLREQPVAHGWGRGPQRLSPGRSHPIDHRVRFNRPAG